MDIEYHSTGGEFADIVPFLSEQFAEWAKDCRILIEYSTFSTQASGTAIIVRTARTNIINRELLDENTKKNVIRNPASVRVPQRFQEKYMASDNINGESKEAFIIPKMLTQVKAPFFTLMRLKTKIRTKVHGTGTGQI